MSKRELINNDSKQEDLGINIDDLVPDTPADSFFENNLEEVNEIGEVMEEMEDPIDIEDYEEV